MKIRRIFKNNYGVSNQLVTICSVSIFIIVVLAAVFNSVQQAPDQTVVVEMQAKNHAAVSVSSLLTGDTGSLPDGSINWEDSTISPSVVGLKMDPAEVTEEIAELSKIGGSVVGTVNHAPTVSNPNPPDDPDFDHPVYVSFLHWVVDDEDDDHTYCDVWFGKVGNMVKVATDITQECWTPSARPELNTEYQWRIIARDEHGAETTGPIWYFKTDSNPDPPADAPTIELIDDPAGIESLLLFRNVEYSFCFLVSHPNENEQINIEIDWGGAFPGYYESDESDTISPGMHTYSHAWPGFQPLTVSHYNCTAIAYDEDGDQSNLLVFDVDVCNAPPQYICWDGPSYLGVNQEGSFRCGFGDSNADLVFYRVDWGDNTGTVWTTVSVPPYPYAWSDPFLHTWDSAGTYVITFYSKDVYNTSDVSSYSMNYEITPYDNPDYDIYGNGYGDNCCFPSGTLVSMADGSEKLIESVRSGDIVLSYDFETGSYVNDMVEGISAPVRGGIYDINENLISPTDDHPLYVKKADGRVGWAAIDPAKSKKVYSKYDEIFKLEIGDKLFTGENWITIESIKHKSGIMQTYTLALKDYDQFFANGFLVSNFGSTHTATGNGPLVPPGWTPVSTCSETTLLDGSSTPTVQCCFPSGTMITMADYSKMPIEKVKKGDFILSYDIKNSRFIPDIVTDTFMPVREGYYDINKGLISPTVDHPLYVKKADGRVGWAAVDPVLGKRAYPDVEKIYQLEIGDKLFTGENFIEIKSIDYKEKPTITFTLEIANNHQYFANDILVKNFGQANQQIHEPSADCVDPKCFIGDSMVLMADGSYKKIKDVEIGDFVKSYDEINEVFTIDEIVDVYHYSPESLSLIGNYYLSINDEIFVTPDHPLYIDDEWVLACDLKIGDTLTSGDVITSIKSIHDQIPTYNLHTKNYHNYIIIYGDEDSYIIAHNDEDNVYSVGGYDETNLNQNIERATDSDSISIISYEKTRAFSDLSYSEIKEAIGINEYYEFSIELNSLYLPAQYIDLQPDSGLTPSDSDYVAISEVNVLISNPAYNFYDFAVLTVYVY